MGGGMGKLTIIYECSRGYLILQLHNPPTKASSTDSQDPVLYHHDHTTSRLIALRFG